jgi:phosphopantothenate-cysteine ligase
MKILVTSGGTKIPIDRVRDITNMSKGTFGSKIAEELLKMGHEVMFFRAKGSKSPLSVTIDLYKDGYDIGRFSSWYNAHAKYAAEKYQEMEYGTFTEYLERLERWIKIEQPDIVILAAAVSDYGVENFVNGKIRSNDDHKIILKQLPKIIYYIKEWKPDVKLVGFKLLVNSHWLDLVDAAKRSISENHCDMIVANDLADIKEGKHQIQLVFPNGNVIAYKADNSDPNFLAKMVAEHTTKL